MIKVKFIAKFLIRVVIGLLLTNVSVYSNNISVRAGGNFFSKSLTVTNIDSRTGFAYGSILTALEYQHEIPFQGYSVSTSLAFSTLPTFGVPSISLFIFPHFLMSTLTIGRNFDLQHGRVFFDIGISYHHREFEINTFHGSWKTRSKILIPTFGIQLHSKLTQKISIVLDYDFHLTGSLNHSTHADGLSDLPYTIEHGRILHGLSTGISYDFR